MEGFYRTTVFGKFVRLVSGNARLRYPDEIDGELRKVGVGDGDGGGDGGRRALDGGQTQMQTQEGKEQGEATRDSEASSGRHDPGIGNNVLLVGWYGANDAENPQNWPTKWKLLILAQMFVLNFAIYIGSSIYVPGEAGIMVEFGASETVATLGVSMYTVGYGLGPMLWSPLSEIPSIGRSTIFFWTLLLFVLLQLAVGFAPNMATFLVFRTITGFVGSPCLATGGGTIADMYEPAQILVCICCWSMFGVWGPIFGPLIGGCVAPVKGWSWTIWIFTWLCSAVLITMFFLLPETSASNILHQRAQRLRHLTKNPRLKSQSDFNAANLTLTHHLRTLARAFTLTFSEPIVFLMDLYTGLLYGVLFIWFESFPLVFGQIYGFDVPHH